MEVREEDVRGALGVQEATVAGQVVAGVAGLVAGVAAQTVAGQAVGRQPRLP